MICPGAVSWPAPAEAKANQGMSISFAGKELDHRYVVGQRCGGADDLIEIGRESQHPLKRLIELFRRPKVVKGNDQPGLGT